MKKTILILTALFLSSGLDGALAVDYPTKPITLYVGYVAGGATDTAARTDAGKRLAQVPGDFERKLYDFLHTSHITHPFWNGQHFAHPSASGKI